MNTTQPSPLTSILRPAAPHQVHCPTPGNNGIEMLGLQRGLRRDAARARLAALGIRLAGLGLPGRRDPN